MKKSLVTLSNLWVIFSRKNSKKKTIYSLFLCFFCLSNGCFFSVVTRQGVTASGELCHVGLKHLLTYPHCWVTINSPTSPLNVETSGVYDFIAPMQFSFHFSDVLASAGLNFCRKSLTKWMIKFGATIHWSEAVFNRVPLYVKPYVMVHLTEIPYRIPPVS